MVTEIDADSMNIFLLTWFLQGLTQCISPIRIYAQMKACSLWRGNLHFRVYSPDKPDTFGLKAYILCEAENWYCLKMKLYTGKLSVPPSVKGGTYDLVMSLLRNHYACCHILYCDNYYSSPQLFWIFGVQEWVPLAQFILIDVGYPK